MTYLDNAATTLKPQCMVDAICRYYLGISANIHRGKHVAIEEVSNQFEQTRYKVANLLGCKGNEIIFQANTTEAINLVANGLNLSKRDVVVCFQDSHHSNFLPWLHLADTRLVNLTDGNLFDIDHYKELLKLRPKVVALTHCSNASGIYVDLKELTGLAKAAGATVVVDAAQSVPHRRINVSELDVDFLAFSAHKMLGPTGVGVLYGKVDALKTLAPYRLGGGMVDWVERESYDLRKIPHRFEAGTPHIAGVLGLGAALDYLNKIGFDTIQEHDKQLGDLMLEEALKRDYLVPLNAERGLDRGAIMSMFIPGHDELDDVARYLSDSFGIMCRNGHLCTQPYINAAGSGQVIRASAYIYNTEKDIHYFFESLDSIISFL